MAERTLTLPNLKVLILGVGGQASNAIFISSQFQLSVSIGGVAFKLISLYINIRNSRSKEGKQPHPHPAATCFQRAKFYIVKGKKERKEKIYSYCPYFLSPTWCRYWRHLRDVSWRKMQTIREVHRQSCGEETGLQCLPAS